MRRRALEVFTAGLVAVAGLVGAPIAHPGPSTTALAAGAFTDPHFREVEVLGGLDHPTVVRFAADGRVFVAEKRGVVKAFDSIDDGVPTTALDIRTDVMDYWDRGLVGMVLDPAFLAVGAAARPYVYVYYVHDAPAGAVTPPWNDTCQGPPTGPGPVIDGCPAKVKLVRFTIDISTNLAVPGSGVELIRDWCAQFPSHNGGGMAFGRDGMLYVAGGDGANFQTADYGQRGGTIPDPAHPITPINPCGDPIKVTSPSGATPVIDVASAQGGSLRSQDVRTPADPVTLDGTLIRVDPDTGLGAAGNPLAGSADANARRVVAYGFRNPFRITVHPSTGDIYVADVGAGRWEEIDRVVPPPAATTARNYGWPCYEGPPRAIPFSTFGLKLCDDLYAAGASAVTAPVYAFAHTDTAAPCGAGASSQSSLTGLAFYDAAAADGNPYPARYDGALFYVDYSRNCLAVLRRGANGAPDPSTAETVATGLGHPVDLETGPHGDLYYANQNDSRVMRIRYAPSPVARATVTPDAALAPVTVTLDGSASTDPDVEAGIVSWGWDLDDDGAFDGAADRTGKVVSWQVVEPALYPITLRVTSSNGLSDTLRLAFDGRNQPPVPHIDGPAASLAWSVGDEIAFSGGATDADDGPLDASALRWSIVLLHCRQAGCHEHAVETFPGVAGGTFEAPDHEYPSRLLVRLTAKDSGGGSATTSVELLPTTTTLDLVSVPAGASIAVGEATKASPSRTTLIRGGTTTIVAPATWTAGSKRYRFAGWSDGLPRAHEVTVTAPTTRAARYVRDAADTCRAATPIETRSWRLERASGEGDVDWFRFTLTGRRRVVVTLGDLPVDARLDLYGACGTRLASSQHAGLQFERVTRSLPAGTYRVRVRVPSGAAGPSPYALRILSVRARVAFESRVVRQDAGVVRVAGRVVNGTGNAVGRVRVVATFRDARGRIVATLSGRTFAPRLADGAASSFLLTGRVPAYATVAYALTPGVAGPERRLSVGAVTGVAGAGGTVLESGQVRNDGPVAVTDVRVARTWLGSRGQVIEVGITTTTPSVLPPGGAGTFTVVRPPIAGVQVASTELRAR